MCIVNQRKRVGKQVSSQEPKLCIAEILQKEMFEVNSNMISQDYSDSSSIKLFDLDNTC